MKNTDTVQYLLSLINTCWKQCYQHIVDLCWLSYII